MSLFHPRVIEKHTKDWEAIDARHDEVLRAWAENLQQGIYDSETQNDGEFIQRILIDVLGYVGSSGGQSWTVAKNQPVGKGNVDVALGEFSADSARITAPFELKGAKTRDLDAIMPGRNKTPAQQAWEYAMDAKGAQWVLVSNFRTIRLYAIGYGRKDFETFDLSKLDDPAQYARFRLLLSAENLLNGKTLALLKESERVDKDITNQLYEDYKALRARLIKTIGEDNPDKEPLDVIGYAQTILDRILFIAFAEDKGLLPEDTIKKAYETKNPYNPQPVWDNFKGLFHAINTGNAALNIPGYNGGLFAADPEFDSLNISDELCESFKQISEYDFDSDVSVNILGHIFEQSISDLEELKAVAEGVKEENDEKESRRKKEGIFYTPAYITRYIAEQAVGSWLNDRKKELGFQKLPVLTDKDYESIKVIQSGKRAGKITYNKNIEKHIKVWEEYKEILSNIKVLDPACGSGAFLTEVFDYLKSEGEAINSELARLKGEQTALFRWDTHILANNIYGVDLNRESVEITKLSLWLKTANRREKLTYLEDNIKVGNSLIDDPKIAGELAFDWNKEFSDIMAAGGFDVVVGNPPYGASLSKEEKKHIRNHFKTTQYNFDTYISFFELSLSKMKDNAYLGFITPNTFLVTENSTKIREILIVRNSLISLMEIFNVFPDAVVEPIVAIIEKRPPIKEHVIKVITTPRGKNDFSEKIANSKEAYFKLSEIKENDSFFFNYRADECSKSLARKLCENNKTFDDYFDIRAGTKLYEKGKGTPPQTAQTLRDKPYTSFIQKDHSWSVLIRGTDVQRYRISWQGEYVSYGEWLAAPRSRELFYNPKIVIRRTDDKILASLDLDNMIGVNSVHCAQLRQENNPENLKFYLGLLNSRLLNWLFQFNNFHMVGKPLAEVKVVFVTRLPVADANAEQKKQIASAVENILEHSRTIEENVSRFLSLMKSEFNIERISRKLDDWYSLEFKDLVNEIEKIIKPRKLSLQEKTEWMTYFEAEKSKAMAIIMLIEKTDLEIDQKVYELYGLTPNEIALVEESV